MSDNSGGLMGSQAVRGVVTGMAGGACCFAGAIAAGLGLGGVSFFGAVMDRYQPMFIAASVLMMGVWLRRTVQDAARGGWPAVGRPIAVMAAAWAMTLLLAMVAAQAAGLA